MYGTAFQGFRHSLGLGCARPTPKRKHPFLDAKKKVAPLHGYMFSLFSLLERFMYVSCLEHACMYVSFSIKRTRRAVPVMVDTDSMFGGP